MGTRVLLVARTLPWQIQGGMEQHAWQLARALAAKGCHVRIYTTAFDAPRSEETRDGVHITYLPHLPADYRKRPFWRWWEGFAPAAAAEFQKQTDPFDVVLSEMLHAWRIFESPQAAKALRCFILHGSTAQDYAYDSRPAMLARRPRFHPRAIAQAFLIGRRLRRERRRILPTADLLVAISPWVAHNLRVHYGATEDRLLVIGNGAELPPTIPTRAEARQRLGIGPDEVWILYVGRMEEAKGPRRVLDAVAASTTWRLALAGEGALGPQLYREAQGNPDLSQRLRLLGRITDAQKWNWLAAADVLALPSRNEGQPITILESIAAETPAATTRDWVPPELRPAVAVGADTAATIQAALGLRYAASAAAPLVRSQFSWEHVAEAYLRLIKEWR